MGENSSTTVAAVTRTILYDSPVADDKFSGGGHSRTAAALARTIEQFDEGDRAIGLEGSWGSGKSSIVKMTENELRKTDKKHSYHVFTYDLWANQTSHFRRSFLETLLNWASSEFPSKSAVISKRQEQVANKKQTIKTDNFKRFNWFGAITVFLLYFSPVIYMWLGPSAFRDAKGPMILSGTKITWLIIVIYIVLLLIHISQSRPEKGKSTTPWVDGFSRALSVFSRDSEVKTIDQSIRDEDPTQYEFNQTFRRIVSDILGKKDRLIVVFDNIDRLPSGRIPDTWAEVRGAFFGDQDAAQFASIIAIVPYAEPVALNALAGAGGQDETQSGADGAAYLQADVFRKSFDVVFNVAPPVLSDVGTFFKDKLKEAVGGQVADDAIGRIYRIFDLHVEKTDRPVTPRQLISFINDVAGLWEQWQGEISIEAVAVFVAHKGILLRNPSILRRAETIDSRMIQHASQAEIFRDLAALSYNVEPALALQVLSRDAIRKALLENKSSSLQDLADSAATNGFVENLHKVVDENAARWSQEATNDLSSAVTNLANVKANPADLAYSKRTLLRVVRSIRQFDLDEIDTQLWKVIGFCDQGEVTAVVRGMVAAIGTKLPVPKEQTFEQGRNWIKAVGPILDEVAASRGTEIARSVCGTLAIPSGPEFIVGAAFDCDLTNYKIAQFKPITNVESVAHTLVDHASGGQDLQYAYPELQHLLDEKQNATLLSTVSKSLKTEVLEPGSDEVSWRFENLRIVSENVPLSDKASREIIRDLLMSGGPILFAYREQEKGGNLTNSVTSLTIWLALREYGTDLPGLPNPEQMPVFGDISAAHNWFRATIFGDDIDAELVKILAQMAIDFGDVGVVLDHACIEPHDRSVFKQVSLAIYDFEEAPPPPATLMVSKFTELKSVFGSRFDKLMSTVGISSDATYWDTARLDKISPDMVRAVAASSQPNWKTFVKRVDEWLTGKHADEWTTALQQTGGIVAVLIARNSVRPLLLAPANFYEPLMTVALQIMSGEFDASSTDRDYGALLKSLPANSQTRFKKELFERHNSHTEAIGAALKYLAGVLGALPFEQSPDKAIDRYLMPLIREGSPEADQFIAEHQEAFRTALKAASGEGAGVVREFLEGLAGEDSENERVQLLRKQLGIRASRKGG